MQINKFLKSIDQGYVAIWALIGASVCLSFWFVYKIASVIFEVATEVPAVTAASIAAVLIAYFYFKSKTKAG